MFFKRAMSTSPINKDVGLLLIRLGKSDPAVSSGHKEILCRAAADGISGCFQGRGSCSYW